MVTRVLLAMALSKDFTILFGDISVALMNTLMATWSLLKVSTSTMTRFGVLKRALIGLRDASRLFHEHFAAMLSSRLGFARSEAQPTLFVDLARNVFIAGARR